MPQPNFVPVRPRVSRNTQSSGICGATSTVCCFPFTANFTAAIRTLLLTGWLKIVGSIPKKDWELDLINGQFSLPISNEGSDPDLLG
jgi:hypothetical protein